MSARNTDAGAKSASYKYNIRDIQERKHAKFMKRHGHDFNTIMQREPISVGNEYGRNWRRPPDNMQIGKHCTRIVT